MSLRDWAANGWLQPHSSSRDEIRRLFALADRDLASAATRDLDVDWRFAIAYNAALQSATAALAAAGYRAGFEAHHRHVIASLRFTIRADPAAVRQLDAFRRKRNRSSYELEGTVSSQEAAEMRALAATLRAQVERWLRAQHPHLVP